MSPPSSTPKRRSHPRRVGRPRARASAPDVRADLLSAAAAAFSARGYEAVSLRDVAKRACTTAAMVHYYFDDKSGLFAALLVAESAPSDKEVMIRLVMNMLAAPSG